MKNKLFLLSMVVFFWVTDASATIVYTDVNPDSVLSTDGGINTFYLDVDLNNDATPDYKIGLVDTSNYFSFAYFQAGQLGLSNYLQVDTNGGGFNVIPHAWVPQIGPSNSVWHSMASGNGTLNFNIYLFPPSGLWLADGDRYVACKFLIGSSYHYGWMRLHLNTSGPWTITLKDYAYESTANTTVAASIDDIFNQKPEVKFYQAASSTMNMEVKTKHIATTVQLVDLQGKVVKQIAIDKATATAGKTAIDVSGLAEGIYVYRINFENDVVLTGKTFVSVAK